MNDVTSFLSTWTTAERKGDVGTLATLLTDDFLGVGPLGFTLPKSAWLARHEHHDLTYETFDLDEQQVRSHGTTTIVTARQSTTGAYQGRPIPEAVRVSLVLVADAGQWQLAGAHMSFIAGTSGAPPLPG
jgi:ketosteroid isomerase-like protein